MIRRIRHITLLTMVCATQLANAQNTEKVYLSGTGSDNTVNWEFFCTGGMNANKWTKIAVPSCWELQGFGKYDYGFAKDSVRGKEKGLYKHTFNVPSSWKGKVINIVFEGVMTDAEVKINGQSAGPVHQGAFYAFKYDISKLVKHGENNLLEVTVSKHSANESVNNAERKADFWIFGGIFRPVWLEVLPEIRIEKIHLYGGADGKFIADIKAAGSPLFDVKAALYDERGVLMDTANFQHTNLYSAWTSFRAEKKIRNYKLWSPESPVLYTAVITIVKGGKTMP